MSKLEVASVLAFDRKLASSDATMHSCLWSNKKDKNVILVREKAVRGTMSNRQKAAVVADPAKLDQEVQKPNLQTVDTAALPFEHDSLAVCFTLRVLGGVEPSVCNDPNYREALMTKVNSYAEESQFEALAYLYAENIANGRFLWRNRVGAEAVEVQVKAGDQQWVFDAQEFSLRQLGQQNTQLSELAQLIQKGLSTNQTAFMEVTAYVKLGNGQEVFPSQELLLDSDKTKSKILYSLSNQGGEENRAAMHSQKIGNALRTIDIWHPEFEQVGPIAAETFGAVTSNGKAYRNNKTDFYTLLDNWVLKDQAPPIEQQHYVMAVLLRGGVFGEGKSN